MSLDLVAIRKAISDQLQASLSGPVRCYAYPPASIVIPANGAVIFLSEGPDPYLDYLTEMSRHLTRISLKATVVVGVSTPDRAAAALDAWLSCGSAFTNSIVDTLFADQTFGGVANGIEGTPQCTAPVVLQLSKDDPNDIGYAADITFGVLAVRS